MRRCMRYRLAARSTDWACSCRAAWLPVQRVHQALRNQLLATTLQMPDSTWLIHSASLFHFDVPYTLPLADSAGLLELKPLRISRLVITASTL